MRRRIAFVSGLALSLSATLALVGCSTGSTTDAGGQTPTTAISSAAPTPSGSPSSSTPTTASSASSTASMPAQPGTVVAREDFSDARHHRFGTKSNAAATSSVSGGKYRMVLRKADLPHGQLAEVTGQADAISIAFDASTTTAAPGAWMGPLCFFQQQFGFSLRVHPDGAYELVQISVQGADMATLRSGTVTPVRPGTVVRMRLDCQWGLEDATATGWIGTTQIGPAVDVEASDNILRQWAGDGFWAMSPKVPATVLIDNVVLSQKGA